MEKSRRAAFLFDDDGDEDQNDKQNKREANKDKKESTLVNRAGEKNNNENFTSRGLPNDTSKDRSSGLLASLLCCCGPRRN